MRKYYHEGDGIIREINMNKKEFELIKDGLQDFTYEDLLAIMELAYCQIENNMGCDEVVADMGKKRIESLKYKIASFLSDEYS